MLAMFVIRKTFCKLTVTLHVDVEAKSAETIVTYDRRIKRIDTAPIWEVDTVEKAEKWMGRSFGERGSLVEYLEWGYRTGTFDPTPVINRAA